MKLKDKFSLEKIDILMYNGIYDLASKKNKRIAGELIPSFIIEESLAYFCEFEKYEMCQKIKVFFQKNYKIIIQSTREQWWSQAYDLPKNLKKQKS